MRSQNGYPANDRAQVGVYTVPGSKVRLALRRGVCADVLLYLAGQFDDEVEDIDTARTYVDNVVPGAAGSAPSTLPDDWSYAERPVRGSTTVLSNHASGTAIDLNAAQHPRGAAGTFTAGQVAAVRRVLADLIDPVTGRCVVRWGEDYRAPSTVDGMHFEIDADEAAVARVAARIRHTPTEDDDMTPAELLATKVPAPNGDAGGWTFAHWVDWMGRAQLAQEGRIRALATDLANTHEQLAAVLAAVAAIPAPQPADTVTQADLEAALRTVLGSLDTTPA